MTRRRLIGLFQAACVALSVGVSAPARAERLCDPSFEDCRTPLLNYIRNENVGIDVAFWFMQDARYQTEILKRWQAGVPVRILVDPRANDVYPGNAEIIDAFRQAGIPMRYRTANGILHWKTMLFAGQNVVEFDGANYSPTAFVYEAPYSNYEDESIYFADDPSIVNSFKTKYDDLWLDTVNYANYANITGALTRVYAIYPKDPALNFPQQEDYALRILKRYAAETEKIDVIMYRITDERHTNAMIAAQQRGVPVRILGEMKEYRLASRPWVSYNMDRLWAAGIPLRVAVHAGLNHQKLVMLYGQDMAVFGSSNWTTPSANQQQEHNYFATKPWIFQWFVDQFERKWNNLAPNGAIETGWFTPLPPDKPVTLAPADVAVGQSLSMALKWDGGPWGQQYDIYFGTDPNPPLFAANQQLGPTDPATPTATQKFVLPLLQHGTTYYWRVISKTMAGLTAKGPIVSFTTSGTPPPPPPPPSGATTIVMWTATDVAAGDVVGNWQWTADNTAAGGRALWNPDRGQSKVSPPLAAPANYFETTFDAAAGAYRVWLRMRAQSNSTSNNSVSVQFNDAVDQYGSPLYRIGSAQGAEIALQDPSGTLSGWGWDDNSVNGQSTLVYFAAAGQHRLRIQQRSDGAIVDQIVLSPDAFISSAPGGTKSDATIYGSTIDGAAPPPPSAPPPPPPSLALPSPWTHQDIGNTILKGYAEFDGSTSTFSVAGTGADVWGTADALHFASVPLTGDGTIVAHVASVQNTNVWAKAGVMIRETASPGSADAFMLISPARGTAFQRRKVTGATTSSTTGSNAVPPYWVRLDRAGNTFSAYQSADGAIWRLVGTDTIPMAAGVLIGLGNASHTTDSSSVATFDRVSVNGVPVGGTPSCQYTISPVSQDVGADAAAVGVNVTSADSCAWTAASNASWMTVTGGSSGSGNGSVTIGVSANTGAARTGTVTVAAQTFTVSQAAAASPCSYAISPAAQSLPAGAGTATVAVTTGGSCTWTAATNASWIVVTGGASGTGNGNVTMNVGANSGPARTGTVTIAGQPFTVSQAAAPSPCSYAISPTTQAMVAGGGTAAVTVTTDGSCSWTAVANAPWIAVTAGASGTGNGTVSMNVAANSGTARTGTVTIAGQTFTVPQDAAPPSSPLLPPGWAAQDIGVVGVAGNSAYDGTTFTVSGGGADVWGTADALYYSYTGLTGDGSIVARVATIQNTNAWVKAGVMIRQSVDPGSAQGFMLESFSKGLAFQRRVAANGVSTSTAGTIAAAPYWVRVDRVGDTLRAYQSADGVLWILVGTDTIPMGANVLAGLGVSSHTTTAAATATFDHVSVTAGTPADPTALPAGWSHQDIGSVGVAGSAAFNPATSAFVVKGAGADIWGTADAFHYAYRPMTGDGTAIARVATIQNTNSWTKGGVMIRETLAPGSAHALMLASSSKGLAFQRRAATGGTSASTAGALVGAPYWVKLERIGNTFNAYSSSDGVAWTLVGSDTIPMAASVYVGLATSSHTTATAAQITFDNVSTP
jgi:phosphatidylserine/phosphatidylglycerophosphate/cardiolipin synthase-like enzyme/regulation of enolase protein 1 (concanavalin A-like superfamily)